MEQEQEKENIQMEEFFNKKGDTVLLGFNKENDLVVWEPKVIRKNGKTLEANVFEKFVNEHGDYVLINTDEEDNIKTDIAFASTPRVVRVKTITVDVPNVSKLKTTEETVMEETIQEEVYQLTIKFLENEVKARDELLTKIQNEIKIYTQNGLLPEPEVK
jgi:hypothetical protein